MVVIPRDKLDALMEMLPGIRAADDACVAGVEAGVSVHYAASRGVACAIVELDMTALPTIQV